MVVVTVDIEKLSRRQAEVTRLPLRPSLAQVLAAARRHEPQALEALYSRYSARVYSLLIGMTGDAHEAEDMTQLVFIRLMRKIELYRPGEAPFQAWLLKLARNVAIDQLRHRRPIPCEWELELEAGRDEEAAGERSRSLQEAFVSLPSDQRSVAWLRHVRGLSPAEIADELGRTEASVHGLHNRARKSLQARLSSLDCTPSVAA